MGRGRVPREAPLHLSVDSTKPLVTLCADLLEACAAHGLLVVRQSPAPGAARREPQTGSKASAASAIFEIADPFPGIRAATGGPLGRDGSTYKIAAYETTDGRTRVSTIRPTHLVDLLGHPDLGPAAQRVESTLEAVLQRAAGWPGPAPSGPTAPDAAPAPPGPGRTSGS